METTYTDTGVSISKVREGYIVPAIVEGMRLARAKWPDKQFKVAADEADATVHVTAITPPIIMYWPSGAYITTGSINTGSTSQP